MRYRSAAATLLAIAILASAATDASAQSPAAPRDRTAQAIQSPSYYTPSAYYRPSRTDPYAFPLLPQQQSAERPRTRIYVTPRRKHRTVHRKPAQNLRSVAIRQGFKRVSDLVHFPSFFPGLGVIFVKPETLPLGPFLCFDRKDKLVATVYMVPIKDMQDKKTFDGGAPSFAPKVDHSTIYYNAGHPGVDMPHYHIVLWHVDKKGEEAVAK